MKIRKIKHKTHKFFGYKEDKWAKGGGRHGYARSYGKNKSGCSFVDGRTLNEKVDAQLRKELNDFIEE